MTEEGLSLPDSVRGTRGFGSTGRRGFVTPLLGQKRSIMNKDPRSKENWDSNKENIDPDLSMELQQFAATQVGGMVSRCCGSAASEQSAPKVSRDL